MSLYVQYHNSDMNGLKRLFSDEGRFRIWTRVAHVRRAQGTLFLIVGMGRPKRYFLWETFQFDHAELQEDETYLVEGPGWRLCPPQRLEGEDFDGFKNSCANFLAFRKIDDLPYSTKLKELAAENGSQSPEAMQPFLQELLGLLKEGTEDYQIVVQQIDAQPAAPASKEASSSPPKRLK
jgi:hypothetical protein